MVREKALVSHTQSKTDVVRTHGKKRDLFRRSNRVHYDFVHISRIPYLAPMAPGNSAGAPSKARYRGVDAAPTPFMGDLGQSHNAPK